VDDLSHAQLLKSHCFKTMTFLAAYRRAEVYRIWISGLESGRIQHILNKPDRIPTTVLFKFPDQDQDFQISLFWDLTPTLSQKEFLHRFKGCNVVHINCKCVKEALLHRTCHALQSTSPPPQHPISPLSAQVCQIGHFMTNFEKFGHFLNALAMKKHTWPFYKIWPFFHFVIVK